MEGSPRWALLGDNRARAFRAAAPPFRAAVRSDRLRSRLCRYRRRAWPLRRAPVQRLSLLYARKASIPFIFKRTGEVVAAAGPYRLKHIAKQTHPIVEAATVFLVASTSVRVRNWLSRYLCAARMCTPSNPTARVLCGGGGEGVHQLGYLIGPKGARLGAAKEFANDNVTDHRGRMRPPQPMVFQPKRAEYRRRYRQRIERGCTRR